jgi:hypothetical protein
MGNYLLSITGITNIKMSSWSLSGVAGIDNPALLGSLIANFTTSVSKLLSISTKKRELNPISKSSPL